MTSTEIAFVLLDEFLFRCWLVYFCWQDDSEDLTFKKADIMEVLRKDEDDWWFARHSDGRTGSIPVPYVVVVSFVVHYHAQCKMIKTGRQWFLCNPLCVFL